MADLSRDGERLRELAGGSVEFSPDQEDIREFVERTHERPAIAARTRERYCLFVHALRLIDVHDRERVCVAVRVDTDDVVQLICEHPKTDLQPKRWGTRTGVGLGMQTAGGRTVTGHALTTRTGF